MAKMVKMAGIAGKIFTIPVTFAMANIGNFLRVANYDDNPPKNLRA
jgi:hypothetical protein